MDYGVATDVAQTPRQVEVARFLDAVAVWASCHYDIMAVALVGSYARGTSIDDSDVDIMLLSGEPMRYIGDDAWTHSLGATDVEPPRVWGAVTERRLVTPSGLEIEMNIAAPTWADTDPVDSGTEQVVDAGMRVLYDPRGLLTGLRMAIVANRYL
jgi:hypothetical protein